MSEDGVFFEDKINKHIKDEGTPPGMIRDFAKIWRVSKRESAVRLAILDIGLDTIHETDETTGKQAKLEKMREFKKFLAGMKEKRPESWEDWKRTYAYIEDYEKIVQEEHAEKITSGMDLEIRERIAKKRKRPLDEIEHSEWPRKERRWCGFSL